MGEFPFSISCPVFSSSFAKCIQQYKIGKKFSFLKGEEKFYQFKVFYQDPKPNVTF